MGGYARVSPEGATALMTRSVISDKESLCRKCALMARHNGGRRIWKEPSAL